MICSKFDALSERYWTPPELFSSGLVILDAARAGMLPWFIKKARAFVCGVGFLDVTR